MIDDYLHADKYERFLQIDAMICDRDCPPFPVFPNSKVCKVFTISQKGTSEMKLISCM